MLKLLSRLIGLLLLLPALAGAQTATIMPSPWQVVLDSNGAPVSGCKVYVYLAGTTTPATTYTSNTMAVPNAQPLICDSAGRYVAFIPVGQSVKFVIQTSGGVTIKTVDGITAVPSSSANLDVLGTAGETLTAGMVVYLSDGSGSKTAGTWYPARANAAYSATTPVIGVVPSGILASANGTIRLAGQVTTSGLTAGTAYYVSVSVAGALETPAPTALQRLVAVANAPTSLILAIAPPQVAIPTGAVMYFNLAACPAGWTEFTAARGMYLVGLPAAGTLAAAVGTGLTNTENRAVGQHTHALTDAGHAHTVTDAVLHQGGAGSDVPATSAAGAWITGQSTSTATTGITITATDAVAGTNAPYVQLLVCGKS